MVVCLLTSRYGPVLVPQLGPAEEAVVVGVDGAVRPARRPVDAVRVVRVVGVIALGAVVRTADARRQLRTRYARSWAVDPLTKK